MQKRIITIFLLIFLGNAALMSQSIRIAGYVTDSETREAIEAATVFIENSGWGTMTDSLGHYIIIVPAGSSRITASYPGYEPLSLDIPSAPDPVINFALRNISVIKEIEVRTHTPDRNVTDIQMGIERLTVGEVRRMPSLLGEVDILKAIQMMPGVQAASEGGSGFSVRGGSPDQNLILLDNTTLYNPSHLMGFFSVFNNDVISSLDLYKGDLPIRYGGRLSSVLDVRTKNELPERFSGTGGIGLISSRVLLEGPIGGKTSWMVGGRRSYADLFLVFSKDEELRNSSVYFYDMNVKLTHRFSKKDMLDLNGYYGKDFFRATVGEFDYGNAAASITWRHIFSEKFVLRTSLNFSDYAYGLRSEMEGMSADWKSNIRDFMLRVDFEQDISPLWKLTYGATSTHHSFNPGMVTMDGIEPVDITGSNALEHAVYLSNEQRLGNSFILKYGLRFSMFQNMGEARVYTYDDEYNDTGWTDYGKWEIYNTFTGFEPRAGFVWLVNDLSSVKGNFSRNVQYLQLANNSASGTPLDIWFPAGPNVKPQTVNIYSLGYFRNFEENMFETSVEVYYKDLYNVIDFREHANLMLNGKLDGEIRTGTGRAYGVELMVKKNKGRLNGFVNYTLSRSERTIPEINDGKTYLAPYDRTHTFNIMANYDISPQWSVSATWMYATGNPTTYPVGRFVIGGEIFPIFTERNALRMPDYHRLDVSVTYRPRRAEEKRWRGEWNFSVYNAYNKKNPWMITFRQELDTGLPYAEMIYLFGIVPSITYNFRF